ncbi:MAG: FHA domain-containing protein [Marinicella sp.]|nr:FHA domain-containing protein [Xanthomonadales bacterium]
MAKLQNQRTKEIIKLRSPHIFGRLPATAHTVLTEQSASRVHASISWTGTLWQIKDSSSNGTYVNGDKIKAGQSQNLTKYDQIQFGSIDYDVWSVIETDEPKSMLVCVGEHNRIIELTDLMALPDEASPEVCFYRKSPHEWVMETEQEHSVLKSGALVSLANQKWFFVSPEDIDETVPVNHDSVELPVLDFNVSSDEEHVQLSIFWNQNKIDLGERVHHYLLLCLARKKISDNEQGIKATEQGWIERNDLVKMTGMDEKHINIQIYRFREQLLNSCNQAMLLLSLIEKRRGLIRLACQNIHISGGLS